MPLPTLRSLNTAFNALQAFPALPKNIYPADVSYNNISALPILPQGLFHLVPTNTVSNIDDMVNVQLEAGGMPGLLPADSYCTPSTCPTTTSRPSRPGPLCTDARHNAPEPP